MSIAGQGRLADFELRRLTSAYMAQERLASSLIKKLEDTLAGAIKKLVNAQFHYY
jgi:hypothetical protein